MVNKLIKTILIVAILCVLLIFGCANKTDGVNDNNQDNLLKTYIDNTKIMFEYNVELNSVMVANSERNQWNIRYGVKDEKYISCEGSFIYVNDKDKSKNSFAECSVDKLGPNKPPFDNPTRMSDLIPQIKSVIDKEANQFNNMKFDDRDCFFLRQEKSLVLFCFNEDKSIVNMAKKGFYNGLTFKWNVKGYGFTEEMNSLVE